MNDGWMDGCAASSLLYSWAPGLLPVDKSAIEENPDQTNFISMHMCDMCIQQECTFELSRK